MESPALQNWRSSLRLIGPTFVRSPFGLRGAPAFLPFYWVTLQCLCDLKVERKSTKHHSAERHLNLLKRGETEALQGELTVVELLQALCYLHMP
jgi:hypothetical protein